MDERVDDVPFFYMEESQELLSVPMKLKRKVRPKKMDFVGWGSKPLIEFLESIGKDTSKQISQYEVAAIINDYVNKNKLIHPQKKKRILCDERLHYLFGRKSVVRIKIYDLLETHFFENQDGSEDEFLYSSEENDENTMVVSKLQKTSSSDRKNIHQRKKVAETPKSCFAAIISANIKLVYLKRSLVQDLLADPETFESKVVGSFVRVKSDPNDYFQQNSHQLLQVTGVRKASGTGNTCTEILLQVPNMMKDIRICMLSDDNFSEEECEDLRQRVKSGSLKRPTVEVLKRRNGIPLLGIDSCVVEFQQKAQMLHEDITKHVCSPGLTRVFQKWCRTSTVYLSSASAGSHTGMAVRVPGTPNSYRVRKIHLDTSWVPYRHGELGLSPICPNLVSSMSRAFFMMMKLFHSTPLILVKISDSTSSFQRDVCSAMKLTNLIMYTNTMDIEAVGVFDYLQWYLIIAFTLFEYLERKQLLQTPSEQSRLLVDVPKVTADEIEQEATPQEGSYGSPRSILRGASEISTCELEANQTLSTKNFSSTDAAEDRPAQFVQEQKKNLDKFEEDSHGKVDEHEQVVVATQVIEVSDDDKEVEDAGGQLSMWHYVDPQGDVQGPFPMESLKRWSDANYFPPDFKVWRMGQSQEEAVLLSDALSFS
ncbi:Uncharacterized protein LOK49_LG14G02247 [Camellia lanceoleosa]|uniref:Uncharacterized protein n=1 Tax=Camellia lanceoleosa TaxID=1840588 RepID=A0ACC0F955_9ERIC|nr:Uncharacterized protein LOK49_LG14G02247 [Camellia lanceoleosa]